MKRINAPYQPLLLRLIHNLQGILVILAMITAIWTYDVYDGRWGQIGFPNWKEIEGIHGTFGLFALLVFPCFIIYVFHRGSVKLIQFNSLSKLKLINQPIWYYTLHRLINTGSLFALTFAFFSGKMMDEKWLPQGELNHGWYYWHLISLLLVFFTLICHLLINAKIGGISLFKSMFKLNYRTQDNPQLWLKQIRLHNHRWQLYFHQEWKKLAIHYQILELVIFLLIILSWLISLFK